MKLPTSFPDLEDQRKRIGSKLSEWQIGSESLSPREQLLAELADGIEIGLSDIEVGIGGLLTYKGEQVLLYIKDTRSSLYTLQHEPEKSRRFHIAECDTLEKMRNDGLLERYVVTNRMDGFSRADWHDRDTGERGETEARLKVCKNCLKALNWRGHDRSDGRLQLPGGHRQTPSEIWETFSISDFLMEYSTFFISKPSRRDIDAGLNEYVADWSKISLKKRSEANWKCTGCGVCLPHNPGALHVHHKNGVVTDNSSDNLKVLCALCHAEQPGHHHMHVTPAIRRLILRERRSQVIAGA